MLRDYIEAVAGRIASDKLQRGQIPACCTLTELCNEFREDAVEIMRQLHRDGVFEGHRNINKVPMLILKDDGHTTEPLPDGQTR